MSSHSKIVGVPGAAAAAASDAIRGASRRFRIKAEEEEVKCFFFKWGKEKKKLSLVAFRDVAARAVGIA